MEKSKYSSSCRKSKIEMSGQLYVTPRPSPNLPERAPGTRRVGGCMGLIPGWATYDIAPCIVRTVCANIDQHILCLKFETQEGLLDTPDRERMTLE